MKCKSRWTLAEKNRRDKVPGAGSAHPEAGLKYNKVGYSNILRHELHNWFFDTHCVFHMHHIHVQQPDWSICSTIQYFWLWKMKNNTNCVFHMYHIHVQKPDKAWAKQCSVSQETQSFWYTRWRAFFFFLDNLLVSSSAWCVYMGISHKSWVDRHYNIVHIDTMKDCVCWPSKNIDMYPRKQLFDLCQGNPNVNMGQ